MTSRDRLITALRGVGSLFARLDAMGAPSTWRALTEATVRQRADFAELSQVANDLYESVQAVREAQTAFAGEACHLATNIPPELAVVVRRVNDQYATVQWLHYACNEPILTDLCGSYENFKKLDGRATARSEVRWTLIEAVFRMDQSRQSEDWEDRRLDVDLRGAERLTDAAWFRPDDWLRNETDVLPILVDSKTDLPKLLEKRIDQCFGAFRFSQWMASMAMARSTLESMLWDRGRACGVEVGGGTLDEMISQFAERWPDLEPPMNYIRRCGNEVMHPAKDGTVARYPQSRDMATRCLLNLVETARVVYSTDG